MHIDINKIIRMFLCYYPHKIPLGNNHNLVKGELSSFLNVLEVEKYLSTLTCKKLK
ncbi:MAG: hypothetical protein RR922_03835 [Clostridia bacterium]